MAMPRKPKRFLTAEQKNDVFVRVLTGRTTQGAAAAELGVDRTVIPRIRAVALPRTSSLRNSNRNSQTQTLRS